MAKNKFEAELQLNNEGFINALSGAQGALGKFGKELGTITLALGAAGAAFGVLLNWFKETAGGAEAMNVALGVSKQLLTDIIMNQRLNLKEAFKNAEAQSKIREDDAVEGYQLAKMNRELHELTVQAADQTLSLAEKKAVLTKAMEKEKQIKEFLIKDAKEELIVAYKTWQLNIANTKAREDFYKAAARLEEVQGMDSRRLMSQYTGVLQEQEKRARDLADAFTEVAEAQKEVNTNPINPVGLGKTSMNNYQGLQNKNSMMGLEQVPNMLAPNGINMKNPYKEFSSMQVALMDLAGTFSKFFTDVNLGFQGMVKGIITGLKRLVMEIAAKSAILGILSLITGVPLTGGMFKNLLFGGSASTLFGGMGLGLGKGVDTSGALNINVKGILKGRDIFLSGSRYANELNTGT